MQQGAGQMDILHMRGVDWMQKGTVVEESMLGYPDIGLPIYISVLPQEEKQEHSLLVLF